MRRRAALLADFGSTFTKLYAVDMDRAELLGSAQSPTTVDTDIGIGLSTALALLREQTGGEDYALRCACSSAAGGLRMVACGLVPELTAEAARTACMGAGAKLAKLYAFELTDGDIEEIDGLRPDIFLLCGGTDGGNSAVILHNARMLAGCAGDFPILLAGNRSCAGRCAEILAGREVICCENVMPRFGVLNTGDVQRRIREVFLRRIVRAKGLEGVLQRVGGVLMPTPAAVMAAMELLAAGTPDCAGFGELIAVDIGGATTDVFSMAQGAPDDDSTIVKGLPEPYAKRTVEGDIGMRYSAQGVLQAAGPARLRQLSGLSEDSVTRMAEEVSVSAGALPGTDEAGAFDLALACAAADIAVGRHAGTLEQVYTPLGAAYVQAGKNLTGVDNLVLTGGVAVYSRRAADIAAAALARPAAAVSLRPRRAKVWVDRKYILAGMGLLAQKDPACALAIMKKELEYDGIAQQAD